MNKISKNFTHFFLFWIVLQLFFNWIEYIHLPPFGMHQGAQADRASIALNYYRNSMNFFEPRVMESRGFHGITGLEFPIVQYITAILYKIFGFHNFLYRTVMGSIVFGGCFAAWKIIQMFIVKKIHQYLFFTIWYASPILIFYTFSYIPDMAAMSFTLMAWHQFLKYYFGIETQKSLNKYILFICLAGLLKITFLITHLSLIGLVFIQKSRNDIYRIPFRTNLKFWAKWLIPIIPICAWYFYANHLTILTWNFHFLQKMNPAKSFGDFIENTRFAFDTWSSRIYLTTGLIAIVTLYLASLVKFWNNLDLLGTISILLLCGFLAVFILFNGQFRHHDYYFILIFPAVLFALLWLYQVHIENKYIFTGIFGIFSFVGLWALPVFGAFHTKQIVRRTFTPNDYYCQNVINNMDDYIKTKDFLNSYLKSPNDEIWYAFDVSPNTGLYLLQRQGIRVAPDFNEKLIEEIWERKNIDSKDIQPILILNDEEAWNKLMFNHIYIDAHPIFKHGGLTIFKMNYR